MPSSLLRGVALQLARRTATSVSGTVPALQQQAFLPVRTVNQVKQRLFTTTQYPFSPSTTPMAAQTDTAAASISSQSPEQITPESLTRKLQQSIQTTHISIQDMSGGCGQAFTAVIVSPEFEKKTLLARHRLVNGALKGEIAAIHAWTPKCLTPEQWEKEKERDG